MQRCNLQIKLKYNLKTILLRIGRWKRLSKDVQNDSDRVSAFFHAELEHFLYILKSNLCYPAFLASHKTTPNLKLIYLTNKNLFV